MKKLVLWQGPMQQLVRRVVKFFWTDAGSRYFCFWEASLQNQAFLRLIIFLRYWLFRSGQNREYYWLNEKAVDRTSKWDHAEWHADDKFVVIIICRDRAWWRIEITTNIVFMSEFNNLN